MPEENEAETGDPGMLEGGGSGGGSERVHEHRPQERGGSRVLFYIVIGLVVILAAWPVARLFGVAAETPFLNWMYVVTLVIALVITVPFVYGLIKKST